MQSGNAAFRWLALSAVMLILMLNATGLVMMRSELGDLSSTKRGGLLWNSGQLEFEYLRFVKALLQFSVGHPEAKASAVQLRFDILWSRQTIAEGDLSDLASGGSDIESAGVVFEIGKQLRASEANVYSLSDDARRDALDLVESFEKLEKPLRQYTIALKDRQAEIDLNARNRIWKLSRVAVLFGGALGIGSILLAMLFMVDSRTQRRISRENLELLEQSKAAYQAKIEFLSTVSHELRTPLTSINGVVSLLDAGVLGDLNEKGERFVRIAKANTGKLESLIDDTLDVVKAEHGEIEFEYELVDLAEIAKSAVDTNAIYQEGRTIQLVKEGEERIAIFADRRRIDQVFSNLISNAVKFSDRCAAVTIRLSSHGQMARVSVEDQGIGIPDNFKPEVFDSFTQADSSDRRSRGGTGLGLSIAKRIIDNHGGKIYFESQMGVGSVFTFELPLANEPANRSASTLAA